MNRPRRAQITVTSDSEVMNVIGFKSLEHDVVRNRFTLFGIMLRGVSVVLVHEGRVLMIRRVKPPFAGLWSFPGGAVETGETDEAAALRELREETGFEARLGPVLSFHDFDADDATRWRLSVFLARDPAGALHAGGDAAEAVWIGVEAVGALETTERAAEFVTLALRAETVSTSPSLRDRSFS